MTPKQHFKRGKGFAKTKCPTRCQKTPSPQKEYKIFQRQSPIIVAGGPTARLESRVDNHRVPTSESRISDDQEFALSCSPKEMQLESTYAGARFQSPPSPKALPKPPTHWLNAKSAATVNPMLNAPFLDTVAVHLKGLLNVQA